jgi:hypothetical protein
MYETYHTLNGMDFLMIIEIFSYKDNLPKITAFKMCYTFFLFATTI